MIQFNLLPQSRLYEIKSRKIYRIITRLTFIISILVIVIMIGFFLEVKVAQKNDIAKYNSQITADNSALNKIPDLNAVLKINDAIQALPSLYNSRPDVTRLSGYLSLITPADVSIQTLGLNFSNNTLNISGVANSIDAINTVVDTLKFCEYSTASSTTNQLAFSKVVLASYVYSASSTTGQTFSITADFAPQIFATSTANVSLIVPNKITTRSAVDQPTELFNSKASGQ